ncbi:MAG: CoA transferase, partial [Burkholderiaceae bacterium]|nr:CoA transferase [Burkholderiaceae bacterium]
MPEMLPLSGLRVVELTHMVMGPTCGMILADLGADVVKVEPPGGDNTRRLLGAGAGFFANFNRNKRSVAIDYRDPRGREVVLKLAARADVFSENFKPGAMAKLGFDYASLARLNPRLIYVALKGFLPGPYEQRTALDEVVQMMGGLAYMTGPEGRPLRAGTSVNDIMGGMFGALGVLAALIQRAQTGRGQEVQSALFENNVFLVSQHMLQYAVTGSEPAPMPNRHSPWGIYDVFTVAGGEQIFIAVVSDTQWRTLCEAVGFADLRDAPEFATNNDRVRARDRLLPLLRERLAAHPAAHIAAVFEQHGLPYAPIVRPPQLFDD